MHDGSIIIFCRNEAGEVEQLQNTLARFCKLHGVPGRHQHALNLALDESVTNIIRHGFDDKAPHQIRIHVEVRGNEFSARIEDDGREFSPLNHPIVDCTKPLEERQLGGLGIHLVRSLVTRMEYARENGRNVLTLFKRVQ